MNPFYELDPVIRSDNFNTKVQDLAKKYFN